MSGVRSVQATSYSSIFGYTPQQHPAATFDGDVDTRVGNPREARTSASFSGLRTPSRPTTSRSCRPRYRIVVHRPGRSPLSTSAPIRESLNASSQAAAGQTVHFPRRSFSTLEIRIDSEYASPSLTFATKDRIGLAEVRVGDGHRREPSRCASPRRCDCRPTCSMCSASHHKVIRSSSWWRRRTRWIRQRCGASSRSRPSAASRSRAP